MSNPVYFGGVEGGASNTTVVILNSEGSILAKVHGSGSNGWLLGARKVTELLIELFTKAFVQAGLPDTTTLQAMGLCMSGFLQPRIQEELRQAFQSLKPSLCNYYYIDNDTPGSAYTAAGASGGLVIICGTGTMAQLIDAEGKTFNCGGWGHMFGDEGSAYYIASTAIRRIFYGLDGYTSDAADPVPDVSVASKLMLEYFQISDRDGMLDIFYKDFNKGKVAGFTKVLADAARKGDAFSASIFSDAGKHLGSMARTLAPRLRKDNDSNSDIQDLAIVCVGSVWKSFDLLRTAFVAAATAPFHAFGPSYTYNSINHSTPPTSTHNAGHIASFRLVQLTETSAVGAAWKAAKDIKHTIPLDHSKFTETLFEWTRT